MALSKREKQEISDALKRAKKFNGDPTIVGKRAVKNILERRKYQKRQGIK